MSLSGRPGIVDTCRNGSAVTSTARRGAAASGAGGGAVAPSVRRFSPATRGSKIHRRSLSAQSPAAALTASYDRRQTGRTTSGSASAATSCAASLRCRYIRLGPRVGENLLRGLPRGGDQVALRLVVDGSPRSRQAGWRGSARRSASHRRCGNGAAAAERQRERRAESEHPATRGALPKPRAATLQPKLDLAGHHRSVVEFASSVSTRIAAEIRVLHGPAWPAGRNPRPSRVGPQMSDTAGGGGCGQRSIHVFIW